MPEGAVACRGTWLRQEGEMRFAPDRPWLPFTAEQWFRGEGIDFRWQARVRMGPWLVARVTDRFELGSGSLAAHIFGVIPVSRASGEETDQGEALRGLAELPWRPFALHESASIHWTPFGDDGLHAAYDNGKTEAAIDFRLDSDGRILRASAGARPRLDGKRFVDTPWTGEFSDYRQFGPFCVPAAAEVAWLLPEGPFPYWRGRVLDFRAIL
jgi:hypothetical protein